MRHTDGERLFYAKITAMQKALSPSLVRVCSGGGGGGSRNEYYLGGIIALLLQDHRTMSIKSVCSSQYMVTDQH